MRVHPQIKNGTKKKKFWGIPPHPPKSLVFVGTGENAKPPEIPPRGKRKKPVRGKRWGGQVGSEKLTFGEKPVEHVGFHTPPKKREDRVGLGGVVV